MSQNLFGKTSSIFGLRVVADENIPVIETEYDYLWPVIGGHVWVKGVVTETYMVLVGDNSYAVSPVAYNSLRDITATVTSDA